MAISGSIEIHGVNITGSYTIVKQFSYENSNGNYSINYVYETYVDKNHRKTLDPPIYTNRKFIDTGVNDSTDIFQFLYTDVKSEPIFISGSLIDC